MNHKQPINELLDYLRTLEDKELQFDEGAIAAAYQQSDGHQTLAIKIVSVLGGLLASLAFLGFLGLTGLYNSGSGLLLFGTFCIAGALWISKKHDTILLDTVSISSFIFGFLLLGFGLDSLGMSENIISATFILIALFSLSIVPKYVLSLLAFLLLNGSIVALILSNDAYEGLHVYVSALALMVTYSFLKEGKIIKAGKALLQLYNPLRTGLILSFFAGLAFFGKKGIIPLSPSFIWISSVVILSTIIYLLSNLFDILNITKKQHKAGLYGLSILLLLPTIMAPAVSGTILIILLSFLVNFKPGFALGVMAFIYFICQYYYDLDFTLLTKSMILFATGVLFITLYLFTHKRLSTNEKI